VTHMNATFLWRVDQTPEVRAAQPRLEPSHIKCSVCGISCQRNASTTGSEKQTIRSVSLSTELATLLR